MFNKGMVEMVKWYISEGMNIDNLTNDELCGYLTESLTRDGKTVYWYADENREFCVYSNGFVLSDEEIKEQLL